MAFAAIHVFLLWVVISDGGVSGHGYLAEPPSRNSMWRVGFPMPEINYDDMGLNCGGFSVQWNQNNGRCGVCGDDYAGVRTHEAGGKFAPVNRPVTRCYNKDSASIDVTVRVTAYHKGYFEFRLCAHNDLSTPVPQSCLDNGYLLTVSGSDITRHDINAVETEYYHFRLDLPVGVICTQCVLQWKYNAGNNWGCDEYGCGIGQGRQEQFINCADIAILPDCSHGDAGVTMAPDPDEDTDAPTTAIIDPKPDVPTAAPPDGSTCRSTGPWEGDANMDTWCMDNCFHVPRFCPPTHCTCT